VGSAPLPVASKPPPPPLPKLDTPELDEQLVVLSTVCHAAVKRNEKKVQYVGCAECLGTSAPTEPDGSVVMDPEDLFYPLRSFTHGSFTKPGADEVAISIDGCEPHSSNYGGMLVAERKAGTAWKLARYDSGVHPESCEAFRRKDGRDILVCRWQDGHQSYWHDRILSYDFVAAGPDGTGDGFTELLSMEDNIIPGCMGVEPGTEVRAGQVDSYGLKDETGDGVPDLWVAVSQYKSKETNVYKAACKKWIDAVNNEKPEPELRPSLGKKRNARLVYTYNGTTFVPTEATKKVLGTL